MREIDNMDTNRTLMNEFSDRTLLYKWTKEITSMVVTT